MDLNPPPIVLRDNKPHRTVYQQLIYELETKEIEAGGIFNDVKTLDRQIYEFYSLRQYKEARALSKRLYYLYEELNNVLYRIEYLNGKLTEKRKAPEPTGYDYSRLNAFDN